MINKRIKILRKKFNEHEIDEGNRSPGWIRYQKRIK